MCLKFASYFAKMCFILRLADPDSIIFYFEQEETFVCLKFIAKVIIIPTIIL